MTCDWERLSVADLVDRGVIARPMDGNHGEIHPKAEDFVSSGIPFITATNLRNGRVDLENCNFITAGQANSLRKGFAVEGDVLLSHKATLGRTAIVPPLSVPHVVLTPQVTYYRVLDETVLNARYLRFYFDSPQFQDALFAHATGSTRGYISITRQSPLPIALPPLPEQHRIATVLGSLDDKIELNRKMNRTLEKMAQAIFKSWFIDFDGVPASGMVESELGPIPRGWKAGTLGDVSELDPESWRKSGHPSSVRYIDLSSTKWGRIEAITEFAWEDAPSRARKVLRPGDTVVGTVRPGNGSFALIAETGLTGSTGFAVLRPTSPALASFVYLAATHPENIARLAHLADGGAYPAVRPKVVSLTKAAVPPEDRAQEFASVVDPLLDRIMHNEREARTLATIRDTLLPKLISGELRVPELGIKEGCD